MLQTLLLKPHAVSCGTIQKAAVVRMLFTMKPKKLIVPPPALHQLSPPPGVVGHMKYERDWSRNGDCVPQKPGDTLYRLAHAYELYPLIFLAGCYAAVSLTIFYVTWVKYDTGVRRASTRWAAIRDKYWKYHTVMYDPKGITHQRLPPYMEQLYDEMEEASKKRIEEDRLKAEAREQLKGKGHKKH